MPINSMILEAYSSLGDSPGENTVNQNLDCSLMKPRAENLTKPCPDSGPTESGRK